MGFHFEMDGTVRQRLLGKNLFFSVGALNQADKRAHGFGHDEAQMEIMILG